METKQEVEQKNRPAFIKVSEEDEGGRIVAIQYGYQVYVGDKKESDGYFYYYIPSFNIHFFAKTEDEGEKKANAVMTSFFNYWVKNQGKKAFLDEIARLGFIKVKSKAKNKKDIRFNILKPSIPPAYKKPFSSFNRVLNIAA